LRYDWQQSAAFHTVSVVPAQKLRAAIDMLLVRGLIRVKTEKTRGRPAERYFAAELCGLSGCRLSSQMAAKKVLARADFLRTAFDFLHTKN
jgi:hypothetical protein